MSKLVQNMVRLAFNVNEICGLTPAFRKLSLFAKTLFTSVSDGKIAFREFLDGGNNRVY